MKNALAMLALFGLSLAVFQSVADNEFLGVLDRADQIFDTPASTGFDGGGLAWAWTTTHGGTYQPLAWTSHVFCFAVFGAEPGAQHMFSALLHALAAAFLFLAFLAWVGGFWSSFAGAALFAVHPAAVEAIALPSARGLLLGALFAAISLAFYGRHVRDRAERAGATRLCLALLAFVLALLSHPALAAFALVPLLLAPDTSAENESSPRPGERFSFLFLGLIAAVAAIVIAPASGLSMGERILGNIAGIGLAVRNAVAPFWLSYFYPHPALVGGSLFGLGSLAGFSLLLLVTGLAFTRRSQAKAVFCAWAWFCIFLVSAPLLIPKGDALLVDRALYVALPGWTMALAAFFFGAGSHAQRPSRQAIGAILAVALASLFGYTTWESIGDWRNDITINARAVEVTDRNDTAHLRLATTFNHRGATSMARTQLKEALAIRETPAAILLQGRLERASSGMGESLERLEKAVEAAPGDAQALVELGRAHINEGKLEEALAVFDRAIAEGETGYRADDGRGAALIGLQRIPEAIRAYQQSLKKNPRGLEARLNLAPILFAEGQRLGNQAFVEQAELLLTKAIEYYPEDPQARTRLALLAQNKGQTDVAERYLREVIELNPNDFGAQFTLGDILVQAGRFQEALQPINEGLRVAPQLGHGYVLFGDAYAGAGDAVRAINSYGVALKNGAPPLDVYIKIAQQYEKSADWGQAEQAYRKGLEVQADSFEARYNLGQMLSRQNRIPEAIVEFQAVLASSPTVHLTHCNLGDLYEREGDLKMAVEHYRSGVKAENPPPDIADRLAWILSTNNDATLRDGQEALRLAQYGVRATKGAHAPLVESLAAALAETGDYAGALRAQERAIAAYAAQVPEAARARLETYRSQSPHRQQRGRL